MKRLTRNLRDNSIEAFILALETVNRPSLRYRMEAFCFLFCNAWELLMKAKLLNDGNKIFYRKRRKQLRRSLSLDDCLNHIFTAENDPIKLNIRKIHELRNNATHLVIPFIPADIMGLFQAGVLNYPRALQNWFGMSLSSRVPLGMMALVYDFDPKEHSLDYARMKRRLSTETIQWLTEFQQDIRNRAQSLGDRGQYFYVSIDLRLAITKHPDRADIVLSSGAGKEALVLEVPKDVDRTHPHRQREVVDLVNVALGRNVINQYDVQCVKRVYGIENKPEFYYKTTFGPKQYSQQFVDWIVEKAIKDPDFFVHTRRKGKARYRRKRA